VKKPAISSSPRSPRSKGRSKAESVMETGLRAGSRQRHPRGIWSQDAAPLGLEFGRANGQE
jgi:hypothetical protein